MFDVEKLIAPVDQGKPCGDDLEYDAEMLALEQAARFKGERQFGDTVIQAQEPDWRDVQARCEALFTRTKDLRVAMLLARAALKQEGYSGFLRGLALIEGLVSRYWAEIFPPLDSEDQSAAVRLNALAPLTVDDADMPRDMLREIRFAQLDASFGKTGLRVRDLELALGGANPDPQEDAPTEDGAMEGLRSMLAGRADLASTLAAGQSHMQNLAAALDSQADAPNLGQLQRLVRLVSEATTRATRKPGGAEQQDSLAAATAGVSSALGEIRTRDDATRLLDRVCEWFGSNEPSHPAPLVIRRAQRLIKKDFVEIIKDLAPDALKQVEDVIGREERQQ